MRKDVDPDHVARTMIASVLGFIAQQSLFGPAPVDGSSPLVGVRPLMPDQPLGIRTEPPWSPPLASSTSPAAR